MSKMDVAFLNFKLMEKKKTKRLRQIIIINDQWRQYKKAIFAILYAIFA